MKKIILLVIVFAMGVCSAVTTYDLSKGSVTVPANATAIITQANVNTQVVSTVSIGNNATVTFKGVNIKYVNQNYLVKCTGNATVVLADGTVNTINGSRCPFDIAGSSNTTVVVKGESAGTGKLIAAPSTFTSEGAAIGGRSFGNLRIEGGVIEATGGAWSDSVGPGIGNYKDPSYTADQCGFGNITIKGGSVTAKGRFSGIGRNRRGSCGKITISGGNVTVIAEGMAGADQGGSIVSGTDIVLSGGTVNLTTTGDGGCSLSAGGTLRITEGIIKVVSKVDTSRCGHVSASVINISPVLDDVLSSDKSTRTITCPTYTVTWKNYDGTTLKTNTGVRYGTVPSYSGSTPTRPSTAQYSYSFAGWTPTVSAVTANTTYTAKFTQTVRSYTVTWKDDDGTTLKAESVPYGTVPDYGDTPTKAPTGQIAYAFAGWTPDVVAVSGAATYTATYVRLNPDVPVISPVSGTIFDGSQSVSISCATEGATIHYTTDGSEPTAESPVYRRFRVSGKTTVKAVAVKDGLLSEVATAEYALGQCDNPVISLADGTVFEHSNQEVSIGWTETDGVLRYTLDGSEPTAESCEYNGPFTISESTIVKAKVFSDDFFDSAVVTASLTRVWANVATPVIDAATSFTGSKTKVTLSCDTDGALVRYTLNGNEPNSHSTKYTGPFYVTESCTVKAYATLADYLASAVATQAIEKVWNIGDTMGKPDHGFTTSGNGGGTGWTRVVDATAPDGEAMKSGTITHNQSSVLSTTVMGPGTLSFAWRTSCEEDELHEWDHAEFVVDGTARLVLDGVNSWQDASVAIVGNGEHMVEWRYVKDDVESEGEDAAWVASYQWESAWTATRTTDVPVPYDWLMQHDPDVVDEYAAYETSAKGKTANPRYTMEEAYVAGIDPVNPLAEFTAAISLSNGVPWVTWSPNLNTNGLVRNYTVLGKTNLTDTAEWAPTNSAHRFFKVKVEMP